MNFHFGRAAVSEFLHVFLCFCKYIVHQCVEGKSYCDFCFRRSGAGCCRRLTGGCGSLIGGRPL